MWHLTSQLVLWVEARAVIKRWGTGISLGYYECGPQHSHSKIEPEEIPNCFISRLLVVFTWQLEILVTLLWCLGQQHNTTMCCSGSRPRPATCLFWQICQSWHLSHYNEIYSIKWMNHRNIGLYSQTESSLLTTRQYSQTVCRNKMVAAYMSPVFSTVSSPTSSSELCFVIFFNFWCSSEILVQWSLLLLQHQWKTK